MPRREDIQTIMVIGSGPIVIGQACEFDYSGTQACKALREDGYRVVLLNSNPATIMTDPETADRTYVEPMTVEAVERIIESERPDALLPTIGGQTALNLAVSLADAGVLERHGVQLIGAGLESIHKAEDRQLFREATERAGLRWATSGGGRPSPTHCGPRVPHAPRPWRDPLRPPPPARRAPHDDTRRRRPASISEGGWPRLSACVYCGCVQAATRVDRGAGAGAAPR